MEAKDDKDPEHGSQAEDWGSESQRLREASGSTGPYRLLQFYVDKGSVAVHQYLLTLYRINYPNRASLCLTQQ